jgi:methyltransferase
MLDPVAVLVLSLVTIQRLAELAISRRNVAALRAQGGVEHGREHYPLMVALHAAWLAGLWWLATGTPPSPAWLVAYLVLQALRLWTLHSLGRRWTTRIIVLPGKPLVRRGPYRFLAHPNYVVVAGEILALPMAFGLSAYAIAFSVLNAVMLTIRIRVEHRALREAVAMGRPLPG